ncbi:rifin PIR protein, putative [Plasmodium sp. gorilla clade G2]|uniref:rifin PIR protein, putative n=1 Tax=Plasmodium sp. gorilla clade G2 TaxID=880535 RepID=UPI000D221412|nr:rifin PIR protein, putative [Plasmodium sp. gorilla clade G2]SOV16825.1 rifin PIR protein, putative [Plasmodium sp. gorilla clade G2]
MNIYYINVLLFSITLNILVPNLWNHKVTTKPHRDLCECELYTPPNYDNDPQMKEIMKNFNKQTDQRLKEYDERVIQNRKKCKEQCDKEIQQIILKDKIEKQLKDKLCTLQTDIDTDAIPACVCEKSVADKTEKFCLNCGKHMGAIAPWWGLVCDAGYSGWTHYTATTLVELATESGIKKGIEVGLANVAKIVKQMSGTIPVKIPKIKVAQVMTAGQFTDDVTFSGIVQALDGPTFAELGTGQHAQYSLCVQNIAKTFTLKTLKTEAAEVVTAFKEAEAGVLADGTATTSILHATIIASVVAIVVIVLVMLIIYLILRYLRKKKMKKKLQYIKLLKE